MKKKQISDIPAMVAEAEKQSNVMYDFEIILNNTKALDEKKRILWKQIYRNAVEDRATAGALFNSAYAGMGQTSTDHIAMCATLTKYLEKMSKSNDQLIQLSAMISKEEEQNSKIDPDDLFRRIGEEDA